MRNPCFRLIGLLLLSFAPSSFVRSKVISGDVTEKGNGMPLAGGDVEAHYNADVSASLTGGKIPGRLVYSASEKLNNPDNAASATEQQGGDGLLTRMGWDQEKAIPEYSPLCVTLRYRI